MPDPGAPRPQPGRPAPVAARYGRRPGRRRLAVAAVGVLAVAFVAVVVAVGLDRAGAPVSRVRTVSVLDEGTVRVGFEVVRDPGTALVCQVRARGEDGAEVGSAAVEVPAAAGRRTVVSHDLSTSARAVTGEVRGCAPAR